LASCGRRFFAATAPEGGADLQVEALERNHCVELFKTFLKDVTSTLEQLAALGAKPSERANWEKAQFVYIMRRLADFHLEPFEGMPGFDMCARPGW